jgi:NAD-dependent dihydropyrimidine dehydrogenase PreA subunit
MSTWFAAQEYLKSVVTLGLDDERCNGCGQCLVVCPHAVFAQDPARGKKVRIVARDHCMECGACARNCASEAITVRSGVGCANAILLSALRGQSAENCSCGCDPDGKSKSSCC